MRGLPPEALEVARESKGDEMRVSCGRFLRVGKPSRIGRVLRVQRHAGVACGTWWESPALLWCRVAIQSCSSCTLEAARVAMRFGNRLGASPPSVSAAERLREEGRFTAPDDGRSARLRASKSRLVVGGAWSGLSAIAGPVSQGCVATQ